MAWVRSKISVWSSGPKPRNVAQLQGVGVNKYGGYPYPQAPSGLRRTVVVGVAYRYIYRLRVGGIGVSGRVVDGAGLGHVAVVGHHIGATGEAHQHLRLNVRKVEERKTVTVRVTYDKVVGVPLSAASARPEG